MNEAREAGILIDLNSDLGESFGAYTLGMDGDVMKSVTSANVACGFHAGDPEVMLKTVKLAASAGVAYWWMTRWADRSNLEALLAPAHAAGLPAPAADAVPPEPIAAVAEVSAVAGAMVEGALQAGADATAAFIAAVAPVDATEPVVEPLAEAVVEAASETTAKPRAKARPPGDPASDA